MKFILSLLSLATAVLGQQNPNSFQTLEEDWFVDQSVIGYDPATNEFTIVTRTGVPDFEGALYSIEAFDVCPNGDGSVNQADYVVGVYEYVIGYPDYVTAGGPIDFTLIESAPVSILENSFSFSINPLITGNPAVYTEANGYGTAEFCLRVSMWDTTVARLVNFRQVRLTVEYDLTADFVVDTFATQVIEATDQDFDEEFEVTAGLCAGYSDTPSPFNQGQEVCIEVCPSAVDSQLANIVSIDSLQLILDDPNSGASMIVVNGGSAVGLTVTPPECGESACCYVKFLVNGNFFPVGVSSAPLPTQGTVNGGGTVTLSLLPFNTRRLTTTSDRALQETSTAKFEADFQIDTTPGMASAAGQSFFTKTSMAATAGVAALLL